MARMGIPRPLFAIENKLTKILKNYYLKLVKDIMTTFNEKIKTSGIMPAHLVADNEAEEGIKAFQNAEYKALLSTAAYNLEDELWDEDIPDLELEHKLADIIMENRLDYEKKLFKDASPRMQLIMQAFSIDKDKVYQKNLEQIEKLYLENALARIHGTETLIKHKFIEIINDYVTGKTKTLDIVEISKDLESRSSHMARFFARDQLARLNKATTLATFHAAGVTKVKWITSHDVRVRDTHKALDGRVFYINQLPKELNDYNCRCGLVPVEWED